MRLHLNGAGEDYGFELINGSTVFNHLTAQSTFNVYVDRFFFEAPGIRVLEVLDLESTFVAMRAFDNLTDTVWCHWS